MSKNEQEQFPNGSIKLIAVNDIPVHEDNRPSLPMHRAVPDEESELTEGQRKLKEDYEKKFSNCDEVTFKLTGKTHFTEKIFNKPKQK